MTKPLNGCLCQDGSCESCNLLIAAFEAMRKALRRARHYIPRDGDEERDDLDAVDNALALAGNREP